MAGSFIVKDCVESVIVKAMLGEVYKVGQRRYRLANPEKIKAQKLVQYALITGKLIKPEFCAFCDDPARDAHHPDYSKPLKVIWCCREHHIFIHQQIRPYESED